MIFTFGSLFAGIGGLDLGLERAGMTCRWQAETSPFCQKVLAKHWPDVVRYEDVRDCGKHNLEPVDLICGGFPCQPHSVAGKRKGEADDRNLWPEFSRIITELRPRWVLAENVLGIRTTILDQVLSDLESLAYTVGTLVIPACAFNAPHRRERIFVMAHTNTGYDNPQQEICSGRNAAELRREDVADANAIRWNGRAGRQRASGGPEFENGGKDVADTESQRERGLSIRPGRPYKATGNLDGRCTDVPHSKSVGCKSVVQPITSGTIEQGTTGAPAHSGITPGRGWWAIEPNVGRVAHGVPNRVDRLRGLGNAVVPQVAQWLGQQILETHHIQQKKSRTHRNRDNARPDPTRQLSVPMQQAPTLRDDRPGSTATICQGGGTGHTHTGGGPKAMSTRQQTLFEKAYQAINTLSSDQSVSREKILNSLELLHDEIFMLIHRVEEDIRDCRER